MFFISVNENLSYWNQYLILQQINMETQHQITHDSWINQNQPHKQRLYRLFVQFKGKINSICIIIAILIGFILLAVVIHVDQAQSQASNKKATIFNLSQEINEKWLEIQNIEKSFTQHICLPIEPMFHFNSENNTLYFQTYYDVQMPACQIQQHNPWSIDKENIRIWNKDREVIEWAYLNVQEGHNVLYYQPHRLNYLEIAIIGRIIGKKGVITILDHSEDKTCLNRLNTNSNFKYLNHKEVQSLEEVDVFITNLTKSPINWPIMDTVPKFIAILAYSKKDIYKNPVFNNHRVQKFTLQQKVCGQGQFNPHEKGQGFYSVIPYQILPIRNTLKREPFSNKKMQDQYTEFKRKHIRKQFQNVKLLYSYQQNYYCMNLQQKRDLGNFVMTIYGHKLYRVSQAQTLRYQESRHAIEWIRSVRKFNDIAYYEMRDFNLLVIIQIALLLQNNLFKVVCQKSECSRIQFQLTSNNITNVMLLKESKFKEAFASNLIVTDNEFLISKCIQNNFLQEDNQMLTFFTYERQDSLRTMRQIYTKKHMRQIAMPQSKKICVGFQYLHFYWHSQHPKGFYQIKPSKYIIYSFQSESPQKLIPRKKFLFEQLIKTAQNQQVKIVGQLIFPYFNVDKFPIHPGWYLLSQVHKRDYFRMYMMHNYGGGYTDIKHAHFDWFPYFKILETNQKYAHGFGAKKQEDVSCNDDLNPPSCKEIIGNYTRLIGNKYYIFKKGTSLTTSWYEYVTGKMNLKYQALKKNLPSHPSEFIGGYFQHQNGTGYNSTYPFRLAELGGQCLSRAQFKNLDKLVLDMPYPIVLDYTIN